MKKKLVLLAFIFCFMPLSAQSFSSRIVTGVNWGEAGFVLNLTPCKNPAGRMDGVLSFSQLTFTDPFTGLTLSVFPLNLQFSDQFTYVSFLNLRLSWNILHKTQYFDLSPYIQGNYLGLYNDGNNDGFDFTKYNLEAGILFSFRKVSWDFWKALKNEGAEVPCNLVYAGLKSGLRYQNGEPSFFIGFHTDTLWGLAGEIIWLIFTFNQGIHAEW